MFFQIFGRLECVHAEEKLPMRRRDWRHLCDAMPCSPRSADTENSLSLLLSLLHTGRIENRGRGAELNPNIPPESSASRTEVKAFCATGKIKKKTKTLSLPSPHSFYLSLICCVFSVIVFPPTSTFVLLANHDNSVALLMAMLVGMLVGPALSPSLKYLHTCWRDCHAHWFQRSCISKDGS